jgi:hypothetical protein
MSLLGLLVENEWLCRITDAIGGRTSSDLVSIFFHGDDTVTTLRQVTGTQARSAMTQRQGKKSNKTRSSRRTWLAGVGG